MFQIYTKQQVKLPLKQQTERQFCSNWLKAFLDLSCINFVVNVVTIYFSHS